MKLGENLLTLVLASLLLPFAACSSTSVAPSSNTNVPSIGTATSSGPKQPTPVGKTLQVRRGHEGNPVIWTAW